MTESADKTEGQQATLHNSAAVQQCEQFSFSLCLFRFIQRGHQAPPLCVELSPFLLLPSLVVCSLMEAFHFPIVMFMKIFPGYKKQENIYFILLRM